jgi:hypothetical protein
MIIWLASYPKSGNTWIRLFLDNLLSSNDHFSINNHVIEQFPLKKHFLELKTNVNDLNELAMDCTAAQARLNLDDKVKIFKTHNAFWKWQDGERFFTDEKNTLGVIYIVRDPRNIITSVLNYFHKESYKVALNFMREDKVIGGGVKDSILPTIIASWTNHYNSWKKFKKNYLLVRYEDLLNNPNKEFFKITKYLNKVGNFSFDEDKIYSTIENCAFKNLSKEEDVHGFIDNTNSNKKLKQKFFNLGPKNQWQNILNDEIKREIETSFEKEMKELGYL